MTARPIGSGLTAGGRRIGADGLAEPSHEGRPHASPGRAQRFGPAEIRAYQSESDALQDLVNRNIDGVVTDEVVAPYAIKTWGLPLVVADGHVSIVQKGWGFQKARPNHARAVNEALAEMQADGT